MKLQLITCQNPRLNLPPLIRHEVFYLKWKNFKWKMFNSLTHRQYKFNYK